MAVGPEARCHLARPVNLTAHSHRFSRDRARVSELFLLRMYTQAFTMHFVRGRHLEFDFFLCADMDELEMVRAACMNCYKLFDL